MRLASFNVENLFSRVCARMKNEYGKEVTANDFLSLKQYEALVRIRNKVHKVACFPPPEIPEIEEKTMINFLRQGWFSA